MLGYLRVAREETVSAYGLGCEVYWLGGVVDGTRVQCVATPNISVKTLSRHEAPPLQIGVRSRLMHRPLCVFVQHVILESLVFVQVRRPWVVIVRDSVYACISVSGIE